MDDAVPPFDPSKPFETVKPSSDSVPDFDPSKPFKVVGKGALPDNQQMGMKRGLAHEALKGAPIIGPLGQKALDAGNAYFSGDPNKSFSENYATAGKTREAEESGFEAQHPIASTAAQVAGGVGTMVAGGSTLMGAKLLGLTGSLPQMIGAGALSGGAIGAADAALRGQDPTQAAGIGAATGAAGPVLGRAVSKVAAPFINNTRAALNPGMEAARVVGAAHLEDAGKGGLTEAQMLAKPQASIMHMGDETTRAVARSAANLSPEGRRLLNTSIDDTFTGQAQRTEDFINHNFAYPDAKSQQDALDQAAKIANGYGYPAAYAQADKSFPAGFVKGINPDLDRLLDSPDVQAAMSQAAKSMPGMNVAKGGIAMTPPAQNLELMDMTYRLLRDNGNEMFRKGQNTIGSSLSNQAKAFRGVLDNMVPEYGAARNTASEYFNAGNALEAGKNLASTARPDIAGAQAALSNMNAQEKKLFHDGYLSQMIENARNSGDRRNYIASVVNTPNKAQAMQLALGPDAPKVQAFLHVESIMDNMRGAVQGNSTTVRQLMEMGLATGVGGGTSLLEGGNPLSDPMAFMHGALLYGGLRYGQGVLKERVARQVAELLTSRDINKFRAGLQIASRNQNVFRAVQNADAALGGIGARAGGQAIANKQGTMEPQTGTNQ